MSLAKKFGVHNNVPASITNHVLVFLKPTRRSYNYQYLAWQDLNPPQGGSQVFEFAVDIGVQVADADRPDAKSPNYPIKPGELFTATNPNGQGPILTRTDIDGLNVSAFQAAVLNECQTPVTGLALYWTNAGRPVINMGVLPNDIINLGKTVTLEFEPVLYFMAADPTVGDISFALQDFSDMTIYEIPVNVNNVNVFWTRDFNGRGRDNFSFVPFE